MNSMCVVCLTNHERREGRGGTSVALDPPTSTSIDLKVTHFFSDLSRFSLFGFSKETLWKLEKSGSPEVFQSKQDQNSTLAGYPFENVTLFAFQDLRRATFFQDPIYKGNPYVNEICEIEMTSQNPE